MLRSVRSATFVLALAPASNAIAQGDGGLLPWNKVKEITQHFDEVSPQPPPLETILLGTFDAASGVFIWGPDVELLEMDIDLPYDDVVDVQNAFAEQGIEPFDVQLEPQITGLASVGLALNSSAISTPGAAAHPKPGHAKPAGTKAGKGSKKDGVGTEAAASVLPPSRFRGHPLDQGIMRTFARAAKVAFVVEVVNRASATQVSTLTIDGTTVSSSGDTVDVIALPRLWHDFKIASGSGAFGDRVFVDRPPLIGYFTLEALPLALIYEPPGGKECKQTYTSIRRAGTELRTFRTSESSDTQPVETPFTTMMGYVALAKAAAGAAQNVPDPRVQAGASVVQGAASVVEAAFGSMQVSQDVTHTVTDEHTLSIQLAEGRATSTVEGLGPGEGDVFHFLVKPTFAWLVTHDWQSGKVYVTTSLLGYEGIASYSARSLRAHTMPVPPAAMQDLLLALDPMAAEFAKAAKPKLGDFQSRFTSWDPGSPAPGRLTLLDAPMEYISGASSTFWVSHTIEQQDVHSSVDVVTTTTKTQAGFLSYVSKDVPQDEDSRMSVSQGTTATTTSSETVEVEVELEVADGTEGLMLEVWYDRLFGTFAFRDASMESQSQSITGTVSDESGSPLAGAPVLMRLPDGRSVRTIAGAKGKFEFRPPVKGPAALVLESGGARRRVDWIGASMADVNFSRTGHAAADSRSPKSKKGKKGSQGAWPPSTKDVPPIRVEEKGTTAIAIRGKPTHEESRKVAELLAEVESLERTLRELETRVAGLGGAEEGAEAAPKKSGPADASAKKPAGPAAIERDPTLKGRMGRLSVRFPEGSKTDVRIDVLRAGSDRSAKSVYSEMNEELMPGTYTVSVAGRTVDGVEIRSGHATRLRVGTLRVHLENDTRFDLFVPGSDRSFYSKYGRGDVGLTTGNVEIEIAGQRETVEIRDGEIVEF